MNARGIDQNVILKRRNVAASGCVEDVWFPFQALLSKREKGGRTMIATATAQRIALELNNFGGKIRVALTAAAALASKFGNKFAEARYGSASLDVGGFSEAKMFACERAMIKF